MVVGDDRGESRADGGVGHGSVLLLLFYFFFSYPCT